MIINLSKLSKKDISIAGGKAANLGELIQAGFNVPGGVCVTTDTFGYFQKNEKFPLGFEKELNAKLAKLKGPFAVRSSATTEDLKNASFAGQHDTFLNVKKEKLVDAVIKCFSSLYTERAVAYRRQNKVMGSKARMAVVIQEMVNADYAGVSFTLDPIHKKYLLVEIVKGLGEKLVSGTVTPNSYFMNRKNFIVTQKNENFPLKINLKNIAKVMLEIEKHYKMPMDIEFALKKGKLFILQARPITA